MPETNGTAPLRAVLVTGTAGAGKTIVAKEIHELLRRAGVRNAMIDLDAVGRVSPAADAPFNSRFVVSNLSAMWPNYRALDLEYLVLARLLLSEVELDGYRAALPGVDLRVCRLETADEVLRQRLGDREPGISREFLVGIAPAIADELRTSALEDFVVDNGPDRRVTDVAIEVLRALDWPVPQLPPPAMAEVPDG